MKRTILFIASLLGITAFCQDRIAGLSTLQTVAADTTIIRSWGYDRCVMYSTTPTGNHFFSVINFTLNTVHSFQVDEGVRDMEILDDTVYYCGWAGYPSLCYFPLNEVYTGNVCVKTLWYITSTMAIPKRMEVFRVPGGKHVVMVGDLMDNTPANSFIADAWHPNTPLPFWNVVTLKTIGKELYEDIAVTDNYVVALASDYGTNNMYLKVFEKPQSSSHYSNPSYTLENNNIFYNYLYDPLSIITQTHTLYRYTGSFPGTGREYGYHPNRMVHTENEKIALTGMAQYRDIGMDGTTLKDVRIVSGVPYVDRDVFSGWGSSFADKVIVYNVADIRYNGLHFDTVSDSLILLMNREWAADLFEKLDVVAKIDYYALSSFSVTAPDAMLPQLHSIDTMNFTINEMKIDATSLKPGTVCSGFHALHLGKNPHVWVNTTLNGSCKSSDTMVTVSGKGNMVPLDWPCQITNVFSFMTYDWNAPVTEGYLKDMCIE